MAVGLLYFNSIIYVNVNRIKTEIFIESVNGNGNKNWNYFKNGHWIKTEFYCLTTE